MPLFYAVHLYRSFTAAMQSLSFPSWLGSLCFSQGWAVCTSFRRPLSFSHSPLIVLLVVVAYCNKAHEFSHVPGASSLRHFLSSCCTPLLLAQTFACEGFRICTHHCWLRFFVLRIFRAGVRGGFLSVQRTFWVCDDKFPEVPADILKIKWGGSFLLDDLAESSLSI